MTAARAVREAPALDRLSWVGGWVWGGRNRRWQVRQGGRGPGGGGARGTGQQSGRQDLVAVPAAAPAGPSPAPRVFKCLLMVCACRHLEAVRAAVCA